MQSQSVILIIDDDQMTHKIMTRILDPIGKVLCAENGQQGLDLALTHKPALVLLDMIMPTMSGQEVIQALQLNTKTQEIPVIFVTAETNFEVEANALELGAVDFISKPVNPLVLIARVKTHLRLRHRELELEALYAELDQKNRQLEELSTHDQLTGLYNRVMLYDFIEKQFAYLIRNQSPCCLVMLDLDHFKSINDNNGHLVGDTVLVWLAKRLLNRLRKSDIAFRYGGEEFLVILPQADILQAKVLFEQFKEDIQNDAVAGLPKNTVTVSIGITALKASGDTIKAAIDRADYALYQSKHRGRNRATIYDDPS